MKILKKISFLLVTVALILVGTYSVTNNKSVEGQSSCTGTPLTGFMWSDNVGWISVSSENDHDPSTAGVQKSTISYSVKKESNGDLCGYAWAADKDSAGNTVGIGWIKFGDLSNFPTETNNAGGDARVGSGNVLEGWARACAGMTDPVTGSLTAVNNSCSGTSRTDGWDGWISLKGANYVTTLSSTASAFCTSNDCPSPPNDFAWGSDVVGWINTNGVSVTDALSVSCTVAPDKISKNESATWTAVPSGGTSPYTYSWSGHAEILGKTGVTEEVIYPNDGTYNATVTVTDSAGNSETSAQCTNGVDTGIKVGGGDVTIVIKRVFIGVDPNSIGDSCRAGESGQSLTDKKCEGEPNYGATFSGLTGNKSYIASVDTRSGIEVKYSIKICTGGTCVSTGGQTSNTAPIGVLQNGQTGNVTFTFSVSGVGDECRPPKPTGSGIIWSDYEEANKDWVYADHGGELQKCEWTCKPGYKVNLEETKCRPIPGYVEF